jgi:proteasome lid subunit RPN8/RPN11
MEAVIKLYEDTCIAIVNHARINRKLECGGYLLGYSRRIHNGLEIIVTGICYEKTFGTEDHYVLTYSALDQAKNYIYEQRKLGKNIEMVGCYHSHGKYPASLSSIEDRKMQKTWIGNKATIVYSPAYNEMIGDIVRSDGHVIPARLTTFNKNIYDEMNFNNIALINNYDYKELIYDNNDRPLTLKFHPKRR